MIFNLPKSPIGHEAKKKLLGEAYFLRAYVLFDNYVLWGRIPLRTMPPTAATVNIARSSEEDVIKQIISDLDSAKATS